jgi:hypothetical protein
VYVAEFMGVLSVASSDGAQHKHGGIMHSYHKQQQICQARYKSAATLGGGGPSRF